MRVVLGFAYYFLLMTMALTAGLVVFFIQPLRRLLHKHHTLGDHMIFVCIKYFAFIVIGIIFMQSIYDFTLLSQHIY